MLMSNPTISPVKSNGSETNSVILYVSIASVINFASKMSPIKMSQTIKIIFYHTNYDAID